MANGGCQCVASEHTSHEDAWHSDSHRGTGTTQWGIISVGKHRPVPAGVGSPPSYLSLLVSDPPQCTHNKVLCPPEFQNPNHHHKTTSDVKTRSLYSRVNSVPSIHPKQQQQQQYRQQQYRRDPEQQKKNGIYIGTEVLGIPSLGGL